MSFEWVAEFECPACGTRDRTVGVAYDRLGYPICPECGESTGPKAGTECEANPRVAGGPNR